jgi:bacteriocin biosynthesis cyclodehydratase domain-containing protein
MTAPCYRLKSSIEPFFAASGDVYLLRPGTRDEHVVRSPNEDDRALLRQLSQEPVAAPEGGHVASRIAPLVAAGVVVREPSSPPLPPAQAERYDRQLPYLAELGDPRDLQRRLRASRVVVLGCGGLGTWALGALASVGVGHFVLVDDDTIELSNLNRQILYGAGDVGQPKVDVADWPPYDLARWVNEACLARRVPFITAGQQPPLLKIGPTYIPGSGACLSCHEAHVRRNFPLYDELAEGRRRDPPPSTTLGPASGVVGTLLGLEVMHLLTGPGPPATHDRALLIDMRTLDMHWENTEREPACAACAALPK